MTFWSCWLLELVRKTEGPCGLQWEGEILSLPLFTALYLLAHTHPCQFPLFCIPTFVLANPHVLPSIFPLSLHLDSISLPILHLGWMPISTHKSLWPLSFSSSTQFLPFPSSPFSCPHQQGLNETANSLKTWRFHTRLGCEILVALLVCQGNV